VERRSPSPKWAGNIYSGENERNKKGRERGKGGVPLYLSHNTHTHTHIFLSLNIHFSLPLDIEVPGSWASGSRWKYIIDFPDSPGYRHHMWKISASITMWADCENESLIDVCHHTCNPTQEVKAGEFHIWDQPKVSFWDPVSKRPTPPLFFICLYWYLSIGR
jgi:hypothetical protein